MLVIIFGLYFIWDMLTIREHLSKYDQTLVKSVKEYASPATIFAVYWRGILDRETTNRGPIITLSWMIFFIVLAAINTRSFKYQVFVLAVLAISGLLFYRNDKFRMPKGAVQRGYTMPVRLLIIVILILIAALCACRLQAY